MRLKIFNFKIFKSFDNEQSLLIFLLILYQKLKNSDSFSIEKLSSAILECFDQMLPLQIIDHKETNKPKSWLIKHIKKLVKRCDEASRDYNENPWTEKSGNFRKLGNIVTKEIPKAKRKYFDEKISMSSDTIFLSRSLVFAPMV